MAPKRKADAEIASAGKKDYSGEEWESLVTAVDRRKDIIECKRTDAVTTGQKAAAWKDIAMEFNAQGFIRDVNSLRTKWKNIKRDARKECMKEGAYIAGTGGGPSIKFNIPEKFRRVVAMNPASFIGGNNPYDCDSSQIRVNKSQSADELDDSDKENEDSENFYESPSFHDEDAEVITVLPDLSEKEENLNIADLPIEFLDEHNYYAASLDTTPVISKPSTSQDSNTTATRAAPNFLKWSVNELRTQKSEPLRTVPQVTYVPRKDDASLVAPNKQAKNQRSGVLAVDKIASNTSAIKDRVRKKEKNTTSVQDLYAEKRSALIELQHEYYSAMIKQNEEKHAKEMAILERKGNLQEEFWIKKMETKVNYWKRKEEREVAESLSRKQASAEQAALRKILTEGSLLKNV